MGPAEQVEKRSHAGVVALTAIAVVLGCVLFDAPRASACGHSAATLPLADVMCSADRWCVQFPNPVSIQQAVALGDRLVVVSIGSVVALWGDGAWQRGIDTGLGRLHEFGASDDGQWIAACDEKRCVRMTLDGLHIGAPAPTARSQVASAFGPRPAPRRGDLPGGTTWDLANGRLNITTASGKQKVAALRGSPFKANVHEVVPGADGDLWLRRHSTVGRLRGASEPSTAKLDLIPAPLTGCQTYMGGWLGGGPAHPFLVWKHYYFSTAHRLEGDTMSTLTVPWTITAKAPAWIEQGKGCDPCLVTLAGNLAWRFGDEWRVADLPEGLGGCSVEDARIVVEDGGTPTITTRTGGVLAFTSNKWVERKKAPWPEAVCDDTEKWPSQNCVGSICARFGGQWSADGGKTWQQIEVPGVSLDRDYATVLSTGEIAVTSDTALYIGRGKRWRTERVPIGASQVSETGAGLLMVTNASASVVRKSWADFGRAYEGPAPASPVYYRVRDVAADDVLHVRDGPHWLAKSVAQLPNGEGCVRVLGGEVSVRGAAWWRVEARGNAGWANSKYLEPDDAASCVGGR